MSVLMEFSMFPVDKGESVGVYVSRLVEMIGNTGLNYKLTPMGTIIETGDIGKALGIIEKAYQLLEPDCNRVYCTVKMDIRKGQSGRMEKKITSIESRIGKVNH